MTTSLLGVELNSSAHKRLQGATTRRLTYLPFGHCAEASVGASAFTGQWLEPASGVYLPGNGCRGYLPPLARFIQPDRYSPFLKGGVNAYAYCAADPVNRVDSTGASFTPLLIGTLIGAISTSVLHTASLGSKSAKAMPRALAVGTRLGLAAGLVAVASTLVTGLLPDNQQPQNVLKWINIGLVVPGAALRVYAFVPGLREAGVRKVLGRVVGWRASTTGSSYRVNRSSYRASHSSDRASHSLYEAWIHGRP